MPTDSYATPAVKMRVALADPLTLCREGLVSLLSGYPHITVVGSTGSSAVVPGLCRDTQPDVVILDAGLAGELSRQQLEAIRTQSPDTRILLLTDAGTRLAPSGALSIAKGVLQREDSRERLLKALTSVVSGKGWEAVPVRGPIPRGPRSRGSVLSNRESDIATLVARGMSNREIAAHLGLSEQSVKNLVSRILKKLGLNNRVQIAMRCWNTP